MATPPLATVLLTPELLEAVLFQLSLQDLLRAQRVCHLWRDVIILSPALQQKLFFQPLSMTDHQPRFNQLLQQLFPPFFLFTQLPDKENFNNFIDPSEIRNLDWYKDDHRRSGLLQPEASWRRMFPVQPPARIEEVVINLPGCGCGRWDIKKIGVISDEFQHLQEKGASMGLIWDISVQLLDDNPVGSFFVQWHMFSALPEHENDSSRDVEDGNGKLQVTVHTVHTWHCMRAEFVPCGLKVIDCDPDIINYIFDNDE
jgi:hypothetical protein